MTPAPENGQRIYLRGGLDGDPLSFSIRWFVPAGFEANSVSELQSVATGKAELMQCLTLLGVSALAVMVGDVIDGTPVFETRRCTAVNAAEHILREGQRARGIAYSQTVYVDATPEEVYRRMRLWDSARQRWAR
ncbi:MAG TPA: hypothetical protein VMN04_11385 [Thermoanaerobaculia bacterium]|nr:hypothetical protein [Thermoanaerobaculia bacterium]